MKHHKQGWALLGRTLLIALISHGWIMLAGGLVFIALTYIAAFFLMSATKGTAAGSVTISTPLVTVKNRASRGDENGHGPVPRAVPVAKVRLERRGLPRSRVPGSKNRYLPR